jgi:hypothetical protein
MTNFFHYVHHIIFDPISKWEEFRVSIVLILALTTIFLIILGVLKLIGLMFPPEK